MTPTCMHLRSVVMNTIAVLPHLKKQPTAYLINVTSGAEHPAMALVLLAAASRLSGAASICRHDDCSSVIFGDDHHLGKLTTWLFDQRTKSV